MPNPDEVKLPMPSSLQQIIGALIFGAEHPLTLEEIRSCLAKVAETASEEERPALKVFADASPRDIQDAIDSMVKELPHLELGFELSSVNGGYRFQTLPSCGRWVRSLLKVDRPDRLSRPALESLAIIAYRQPISKSEIEGIRGVMVDHIVKTLMELHLIRIVGRSDLPGRPFLYGTTSTFLDHFGLKSLKELNELDPTLQRSKPSERNAIHHKEKPEPPADDAAPVPSQAPVTVTEEEPPQKVDSAAVSEILGSSDEAKTATEPTFEPSPSEEPKP